MEGGKTSYILKYGQERKFTRKNIDEGKTPTKGEKNVVACIQIN